MAERLIALVLKTSVARATEGSNPSLSVQEKKIKIFKNKLFIILEMKYKQLDYSTEKRLNKNKQKSKNLLFQKRISSKNQIFKRARSLGSLNIFLILNLFGLILFETFLKSGNFNYPKCVQPLNFFYFYSIPNLKELNCDSKTFVRFSVPYISNEGLNFFRTGIVLPNQKNFRDLFDFQFKEGKSNFLIDEYILKWYGGKSVSNKFLTAITFCLPLTTSLFLGVLSYQVLLRIVGFIFTKLLPTAELEKISKIFFLAKKRPSLLSYSKNSTPLNQFVGSGYIQKELGSILKVFKAKPQRPIWIPKKILNFPLLSHKEINLNSSLSIDSKILLIGPSGSGKTFLAKALAGETNRNLINISPFDLFENKNYFDPDLQDSNEPIDSDQQIRLLKMYFNYANFYSPSALFFDNFEFFGKKRSDVELLEKTHKYSKNSQSSQLVSLDLFTQFLVEIDGLSKQNEDVLLLAATSDINQLDPALTRSGRFDKHVYLKNPSLKSKRQLIELQLKKLNCKGSFNWTMLVSKTRDFENYSILCLIENSFIYSILYSSEKFLLTDEQVNKSLSHYSREKVHSKIIKGAFYWKSYREAIKNFQKWETNLEFGEILKNKNYSRYDLTKNLSKSLIACVSEDFCVGFIENYKFLNRGETFSKLIKKVDKYLEMLSNWNIYSKVQKSILRQTLILNLYKEIYKFAIFNSRLIEDKGVE